MQRNARSTPRLVRRGFTLIEVLLVILILGMLATVAIVALAPAREGAKKDTTKLLIDNIGNAMERYNLDIGHYPTEDEGGLNALITKPAFQDEAAGEKWRGQYLKQSPVDAWNKPLNYEVAQAGAQDAGGQPYKLWSNGPDGQSGTDDDITNIPATSTTTP